MKNNNFSSFTDLIAWQKGHGLILEIYKITKNFPKDELFGLTSQIRRACVSVNANLAEGYGRFHKKDKAKFYIQARGSNTEVENFLILSRDLNYIDENNFMKLRKGVFENYKIITGLINKTLE